MKEANRPISRLCKWSRTGGQNNNKKWCLAPKGLNLLCFVLQLRYIFTDMKSVYIAFMKHLGGGLAPTCFGNLKIHLHVFVLSRLCFMLVVKDKIKKKSYRTISCLRIKCQRPNTIEPTARNTGMEVSEFWRRDKDRLSEPFVSLL